MTRCCRWRESASVPTLAAALDACGSEMLVNVEIKNLASDGGFDASMTIVRATIDELGRRGTAESGRWLISSFSWATIAACRAYAADIATAFLCMTLDDARIERIAAAGHAAVHPWERVVTAPLVERCHAAGLLVNVWTSNDPDRLAELADLGVDGVCTDVPAIARLALGRERSRREIGPRLVMRPVIDESVGAGAHSLGRRRREHQPDGVGHVVELEAPRLAECVTVDLVRERRVVFDHEIPHVLADVEVTGRLHTAAAQRTRE